MLYLLVFKRFNKRFVVDASLGNNLPVRTELLTHPFYYNKDWMRVRRFGII